MRSIDLEAVNFHTRGRDLSGAYVVHYADGENAIIEIAHDQAVVHTNRRHRPHYYTLLRQRSELGDVAIAARSARPKSAYRLPKGVLRARWSPWYLGELFSIGLVGVVLSILASNPTGENIIPGLILTLAVLVAAAIALPQADHAFVIEGDEHRVRGLVARHDEERAGLAIVDAVKDEYGGLLSDVVYRIENAALFDAAAPTTRTFTELMVRWDNDRARLRSDERQNLAAEIRVAFDAARAHAERVGMSHLPQTARAKAAVAAKALKLARDRSAAKSERQAARAKASEILGSLTLYYLPRVDEVEQLLGGRKPLALPGRRSAEVR